MRLYGIFSWANLVEVPSLAISLIVSSFWFCLPTLPRTSVIPLTEFLYSCSLFLFYFLFFFIFCYTLRQISWLYPFIILVLASFNLSQFSFQVVISWSQIGLFYSFLFFYKCQIFSRKFNCYNFYLCLPFASYIAVCHLSLQIIIIIISVYSVTGIPQMLCDPYISI